MTRFIGHSDTVEDVKFSTSDANTLASCSADTTVKLWNIATGALQQTLTGHSLAVNSLAYSKTGEMLLSWSADKNICLWDLARSTCKTLTGPTLSVSSASFSSSGTAVVSCSVDHTVRTWNVETSSISETFELTTAICTVEYLDNNQYIQTDRGVLANVAATEDSALMSSRSRIEPFASEQWVQKNGENHLWLPNEYRATRVVVLEDTIILGHASGGMSFIRI